MDTGSDTADTSHTATHERPGYRMLPAPSDASVPFWTGGRSGQLLIHRCGNCHRFFHPPAPACFRCRSTDVGPQAVSGRAKVAAFTIVRHQWYDEFPAPYVVAIVEIDEDPAVRLTTNIVGCPPEAVAVGMPVTVVFEDWDDVWIPVFAPVATSGGVS
jgi:uncharacterized protein